MAELPPLPPGFTLDQDREYNASGLPPLPEGFTLDEPTKTPEARSVAEEAARQLGLGGRAVIEGLTSLASLPSDAIFGLVNFIQAKRGEPMPFKLASQSIHEGLTKAGLPEPETRPERFATSVVGALGGAGAGIQAGRALAAPLASVVQRGAGAALATRPGMQTVGAITGALASQTAAELSAPTGVQMAAGILVGGVTGGGRAAGTAAGRGAAGAVQPLTETGRRVIAGRAIRTAAQDADRATEALAQSRDIIPGSAQTTAQASRDPGLAYFETRLKALGDPRFNQRAASQNIARQTLLDSVADGGLPDRIQARIARREQITTPMRERAYAQAQGRAIDNGRILQDIDDLLANPDNAGESVQRALRSVRTQVEGRTDIRSLYAVRKEINRIIEGRYVNSEESVLRYAEGQLVHARNAIDDAISEVAPSWRTYLIKYAQLSRPIERAETIQEIRRSTALAAPDLATGRDFIAQPKWKNVVDRSLPDLQQTLTRGQIEKLNRITADLDRGAAVVAAAKLPGSDTAANLAMSGQISVANIVSRALGTPASKLPPALGTAVRPLSFLYKLPDESVRSLLVEAMLDPKLAEQLLKEGTVENVQRFVDDFAALSKASAVGSVAGEAATSE